MNKNIVLGLALTLFLTLTLGNGEVKEIGFGVYWDSNCMHAVTSVYWDDVAPGSSKNINIFVRNEGNTSVTLSMHASNWNPSGAADFIHLTWNYTGEIIEPSHAVPITLSLHVDVGIEGISVASFDAVLGTHGSVEISIGMIVSIKYPTWTVDIDPDALNLKSKGKWVTCYIEVLEGSNVSDIDRTTVMLNDTVPVDAFWVDKPLESVVGDYDSDTLSDLMVKFDRQALIEYLGAKGIADAEVTLAITGEANGISFEATDTIKVVGR